MVHTCQALLGIVYNKAQSFLNIINKHKQAHIHNLMLASPFMTLYFAYHTQIPIQRLSTLGDPLGHGFRVFIHGIN